MIKSEHIMQMDFLGRIIIPKDVRRKIGITPEDEEKEIQFEIYYDEEGVYFKIKR